MDEMEQMLSTLPLLKHLELHTECATDLVDGFRWESASHDLVTLNFYFIVHLDNVEQTLDSFRTCYWLTEKRWFVAYKRRRFFSIPYFGKTSVSMGFRRHVFSTATNDQICFDRITELESSASTAHINHYFPNVRTLKLNDVCHFKTISSIVPLNEITHLILSYWITSWTMISYCVEQMPSLHTLSVMNNSSELLECKQSIYFKQIKTLHIDAQWPFNVIDRIEELGRCFPSVEHLHATSHCSSIFVRMIDGFKHLSNGSFMFTGVSEIQRKDWSVKPEWAIYGARRLRVEKRMGCGGSRVRPVPKPISVKILEPNQTNRKTKKDSTDSESKRSKRTGSTANNGEDAQNTDHHQQLVNDIEAADPYAFNTSFIRQRQKAIDNHSYRSTIQSWRPNSLQQLVNAIKSLSENKSI
ncbi:unnamed protein product, partial [Rotaria socialis]